MADAVVPYLLFSQCALYWFMCILQILGIYKFHRAWSHGLSIIDKRYPRFVMVEAVAVSFNLAIVQPALLSTTHGYPEISGQWWYHLWWGLFAITGLTVPSVEVCRICLISYDLHHLHSSRNQQWKTEIDASFAEKDWYLRNKGKWGNRQYVVRLGFVFYIMTSTGFPITYFIDVITSGEDTGLAHIPMGIAGLVITIIPLYLYMKTPRNLQDQCLFHYEFKWTVIMYTVSLFSYTATFVVFYFINQIVGSALGCITAISTIMPSFLSTLWIPHKVNTMSEWSGLVETLKIETKASSGTFKQKLREILNDEKNCEAFVDWMYREFCSEAILSFLEYVQFRKYVEEEIGKMDGGGLVGGDAKSFNFTLYEGMPRSSIVYDSLIFNQGVKEDVTLPSLDNGTSLSRHLESGSIPTNNVLMRCRGIAHLLFKKYIDDFAPHEINISSQLKSKYVDLDKSNYDGVNLEQFLTLYDEVISEMMRYQGQSYRRYEISTPR